MIYYFSKTVKSRHVDTSTHDHSYPWHWVWLRLRQLYNHDVQHEDDKVTGDTKITDLGRVQFNTMHSLHFRRVLTMDFTFSFFRSV